MSSCLTGSGKNEGMDKRIDWNKPGTFCKHGRPVRNPEANTSLTLQFQKFHFACQCSRQEGVLEII